MNVKKIMHVFLTCISIFLLSWFGASCSLNYDKEVETDSIYPELKFTNARLSKFENGRRTTLLTADILEKYRNSQKSYAKNVSFSTWNDEDEIEIKGIGKYLLIDSDSKTYSLISDIIIENFTQNMKIQAQSIHYDERNEQLVSTKDDLVIIEQNDTKMEGIGFAASGVDKSYSFSSKVDGIISTD